MAADLVAPTADDAHFRLLALPDGLVDRIAYLLPPGDRWGAAALVRHGACVQAAKIGQSAQAVPCACALAALIPLRLNLKRLIYTLLPSAGATLLLPALPYVPLVAAGSAVLWWRCGLETAGWPS